MNIFNKKKIIATHDGTFHTDDIFAVATLSLLLKNNVTVVRTRDAEIIANADFVCDVGGELDPARNRYDHHQQGGAGKRDNGIPYAAFGLVWKEFGAKLSGSQEVADKIDNKLVQPIDANDNGMTLVENKNNLFPYSIQDIVHSFRPSWKEELDYNKPFMFLVEFAKKILEREMLRTQDALTASSYVKQAYENSADKRIIILDGYYPWNETIIEYPEPIYVVFPKLNTWRVECVRKTAYAFETRKPLPASWAGKRDQELAEITGVPDATFCHNGQFMAVAKSKEGALKLAQIALLA